MLEVRQLYKTFTMHYFNEQPITGCEDISFTVNKGEFIGITGKSGSGKSTVLKSIYRTYLPSSGNIFYESDLYGRIDLSTATEQQILAIRKKEIGYVSQFLNVMPRVTALEVVLEALEAIGIQGAVAEQRAKDILEHFQLPSSLWHTYPRTFSGGEKLRLNLAQATVKKPKVLLLDEPTASLDDSSKQSVKEMIEELKANGTTMIGIFHDLDFMETVIDTQYNLAKGKLKDLAASVTAGEE